MAYCHYRRNYIGKAGRPKLAEKTQKRLSKKEKLEVIKLCEQGVNQRRIAEQFGISFNRVNQICRGAGISQRLTEEEKKEIVKLRNVGTISGICRGVRRPGIRRKLNEKEKREIIRLCEQGIDYGTIAEHFGVKQKNTIGLICRGASTKRLKGSSHYRRNYIGKAGRPRLERMSTQGCTEEICRHPRYLAAVDYLQQHPYAKKMTTAQDFQINYSAFWSHLKFHHPKAMTTLAFPYEEAIKIAQEEAPKFIWPSGAPKGIRASNQYLAQSHGRNKMPLEDKEAVLKWRKKHQLSTAPHKLPSGERRPDFNWGDYLGVTPELSYEEAIEVAQKEAPVFIWPSGELLGIRSGLQYKGQMHGGKIMSLEDKKAVEKWKENHRLPSNPDRIVGSERGGSVRPNFHWDNYLGIILEPILKPLSYEEAIEVAQKEAPVFIWPSGAPKGIRTADQYMAYDKKMTPEDKAAVLRWRRKHRLPTSPASLPGGRHRPGFKWASYLGITSKLSYEESIKVAQKEAPDFIWPSGEPKGIRSGDQYLAQNHGRKKMSSEDKEAVLEWKKKHRLQATPYKLPGRIFQLRPGFKWNTYLGVTPELSYAESIEVAQKEAPGFIWPSGAPKGIRTAEQYVAKSHGRKTMSLEDKEAVQKWKEEHRLPALPYRLSGGKNRPGFKWKIYLGVTVESLQKYHHNVGWTRHY